MSYAHCPTPPTGAHGTALWCMLNPSTATDQTDDPTIRKVRGFTARLGFARVVVVNLYAARSTDPMGLIAHDDPVGPGNDEAIRRELDADPRAVIGAWGNPPTRLGTERADRVLEMACQSGPVLRLGDPTNAGHPRHPLYVPYDTDPQVHAHECDVNAEFPYCAACEGYCSHCGCLLVVCLHGADASSYRPPSTRGECRCSTARFIDLSEAEAEALRDDLTRELDRQ